MIKRDAELIKNKRLFASMVVLLLSLLSPLLLLCEADVIELDTESLKANLDKGSPILIEFFAPWCPHCQHYKPKWLEISTILSNNKVSIASVDCVAQSLLCQENKIEGYPTIKAFNFPTVEAGTILQKRSPVDVIAWIKEQIPDITTESAEEKSTKHLRWRSINDELVAHGSLRIQDAARYVSRESALLEISFISLMNCKIAP